MVCTLAALTYREQRWTQLVPVDAPGINLSEAANLVGGLGTGF